MDAQRTAGACVLFTCAAACGASDAHDDETGNVEPSEAVLSQEEIDVEVGRVREALGEATCASTPADAVLDVTSASYVDSPSGGYDHPTCRNGYVVDIENAVAGRQVSGSVFFQPWLDPFSCLLNYGYIALYQQQPGGATVRVGDNIGLGVWTIGRFGSVCGARGVLTLPASGDYKAVVAGGNLFGGLHKVRLQYQ